MHSLTALQGNALGRGPLVLHLPMRLLSTIRQRAAPAIEAANRGSSGKVGGDVRDSAATAGGGVAVSEQVVCACMLANVV